MFLLAVALCALSTVAADAYVEIELDTGGVVLADSYVEKEGKLILYRPAGELEVELKAVKAIREKAGELPSGEPSSPPPEPAEPAQPAPPAAPKEESAEVPVPTPAPGVDLVKLEAEVTRKLILANRDLLFAQNRGDEKKSIEKRRDEIKRLQKQREDLRKRLGL